MKRLTILLINDDPLTRDFLRAKLEARDYEVKVASDCVSTNEMTEKYLPDIILLDTSTSNYSGFEICNEIREWSETPIIVLNARDNELDKVLYFNLGIDDYIIKPFSIEVLVARIKAIIRRTLRQKLPETEPFLAELPTRCLAAGKV